MKQSIILTVVLLLAGMSSPAWSQTSSNYSESDSTIDNPDRPDKVDLDQAGTAADLRISPRIGVTHNSSGGGYDGITQLEGFVPLRQSFGQDITFLEGHLRFDNDANFGGSLVLGHRVYDAPHDRIWGGYFAVDQRSTDQSDFYQLGLGFESLGEVIDFRVNGYLPIGETSNLLSEQTTDSGTQISTRFQDNYLLLANERVRRTTQLWETALGGFDAEVGARVARWEDGDLRAFAGLYYYGGSHSEDSFGWRLRLEATPIDYLRLGAALQNDDIFGTNVSVSVGVSWPRTHPRPKSSEQETVALRLGESVTRSPSIVVNQDSETDTAVDRTEQALMNPEEERPYRFQHVILGQRGGTGTFERPFGTVQAALNATRSDGNDIVYVDRGNNAEIPAFRIPHRVQVLSQGPEQILAGMPFPGFPQRSVRLPFSPTENFKDGILVSLPLSNDGRFPRIQGNGAADLVTLGNRTVLSGFNIAAARENGIAGRNLANIELRDNIITNSGRGILLDNVADSVVMFDNTIIGSTGGEGSGQGILIRDAFDDSVEVTIERHRLENNRVGIEMIASGDTVKRQGSSQTTHISDTRIRNNREQGLQLSADSFGNQITTFTNGVISNNGAQGIQLEARNSGSQEFTIQSSTIGQNGSDGIRVEGGVINGSGTGAQEVFIQGNTIAANQGDGISITASEVNAQEFAISNNQIINNTGAGIRGIANNVAFQEYVTDPANNSQGISGNTISGNGDQGITLTANNRSTLVADIKANELANNTSGRPDLAVTSTSNSVDVCVVAVNNSSSNGIRFDNNSALGITGLFEIGDQPQVASQNTGNIEFLPNSAAFTNKPHASSCFQ